LNIKWKNSIGRQFEIPEIIDVIKKYPSSQIHVGTDSHFKSGKLIFATVIAVYAPGECSRYFFKRTFENNKYRIGLSSRLLKEVQDSIEIATLVRELVNPNRKIFVHADISENKKNKSNIVYEQARQWIIAMGFGCRMKPISWASSSIADLHAK
tara:strand:+ start:4462 stop:4923 length:462 start_codon:yes stop_codon:yes gene_type:complete